MLACTDTLDAVALRTLDFGPEACKVGQVNREGRTPLMWACLQRRPAVALRLLSFGADVCRLNQEDRNSHTARQYAESGGDAMRPVVEAIDALLAVT